MHAVHVAEREMIVANRGERDFGEALQRCSAPWALNRELRITLASIFDLRAVMIVGANVREVAVLIAGIDDRK